MLHYGFEKSKWGGVLSVETFQSISSVRQEDFLSLSLLWEEKSIRSRCIWCFEFLTVTEANSLSGQAWRKCQSRAGKKIIVLKLLFFFLLSICLPLRNQSILFIFRNYHLPENKLTVSPENYRKNLWGQAHILAVKGSEHEGSLCL